MGQVVLLHICCGICASGVITQLREQDSISDNGFDVIGFFYNPNINPQDEYQKRLEVVKNLSKILEFELIQGEYNPDVWHNLIQNLKNEQDVASLAEGGKRCQICFRMRLEETYKRAKELNILYFSTTLSISPYKDTLMINKIGIELSKDITFLDRNFKENNGFKKAIEFSKRYNLYRQNYCGCIYSNRNK